MATESPRSGRGPSETVAITTHGFFQPPEGSPCQLVVVEGRDMGRAARLGAESIRVGTAPDCHLVLSDDRVSRQHLSVRREPAGFRIEDQDSRNGTWYEGARVESTLVPVGATLRLGQSYLRIQQAPEALELAPSQSRRLGDMVAESLAMREIFAILERLAQTSAPNDVSLLVEGETGTGKELVARAVHTEGARSARPFVAVDCGALPQGLVESELFGHTRGAFSGAVGERKGAFRRAHGGTLLLDELDSLPPEVQAKLLRSIEEKKVKPVGADAEHPADVRIVAASRQDLGLLVSEGKFRPDLYYRLSVVRIRLPPLRARREDIEPIARELLRKRGVACERLPPTTRDHLMTHHWPGNVRELRNVIDRAVALGPGAERVEDLNIRVDAGSHQEGAELTIRSDLPYSEAKQLVVERFEKRYLGDLWRRCDSNLSAAARDAKMDRKHLRTLLQRHGFVPKPSS